MVAFKTYRLSRLPRYICVTCPAEVVRSRATAYVGREAQNPGVDDHSGHTNGCLPGRRATGLPVVGPFRPGDQGSFSTSGENRSNLTDRIVDVTPTPDGFDVTVHRGEVCAHRHNRYVAPPSISPRRDIAGPLVVTARVLLDELEAERFAIPSPVRQAWLRSSP